MSDKWFKHSSWTSENQDDFWQHYDRCRSLSRKSKALSTQTKHIADKEPEQAEWLLNKLIAELKPETVNRLVAGAGAEWCRAHIDLANLISKRGDHTAAAEVLLEAAEYDVVSESKFEQLVLGKRLSAFYDTVRRQLELRRKDIEFRQKDGYRVLLTEPCELALTQLVLEQLEGNTAKAQDLAGEFFKLHAGREKMQPGDVFWTSFAGDYREYSQYYLRILHEVCGKGGQIFMLGLLAGDTDLTPKNWFSKLNTHLKFFKGRWSKSETQVTLKTKTTIFDFRWLTRPNHLELAGKPLFKAGIKIPQAKYAFVVTGQAIDEIDQINDSIEILGMIEEFDELVFLNNSSVSELLSLAERVCKNPRAVIPVFPSQEQRLDSKKLDKQMRKLVLPTLRELGFQHVSPTKAELWDQNDNRYCQLLFTRNWDGPLILEVRMAIYYVDQIPKDAVKRYLNKAGRLSFKRYVMGSYYSSEHWIRRPCPAQCPVAKGTGSEHNHRVGWYFSEMNLDYSEKLLKELAEQLKKKMPELLAEKDLQN